MAFGRIGFPHDAVDGLNQRFEPLLGTLPARIYDRTWELLAEVEAQYQGRQVASEGAPDAPAPERYQRLPAVVSRGLVPAVVRRLPVSHRRVSFDYRAKRFVAAALAAVLIGLNWFGFIYGVSTRQVVSSQKGLGAVTPTKPSKLRRKRSRFPQKSSMLRSRTCRSWLRLWVPRSR